jgi:hypothetical protein
MLARDKHSSLYEHSKITAEKKLYNIGSSNLYYKHITIGNDSSIVINYAPRVNLQFEASP